MTNESEALVSNLESLLASGAWRDEARLAGQVSLAHARLAKLSLEGEAVQSELDRLNAVRSAISAREAARFASERALIAKGELRGRALVEWLAACEPFRRDLQCEQLLGISVGPLDRAPLDDWNIAYVPSGVAPIVHAILDTSPRPDDVFVDLGAGLGKAVMLANLLTGVPARGIEIQSALAEHARTRAAELGLSNVRFEVGDAREADIGDGTIFFLYLPFTGVVLARVLERLREVAQRRAIVVCALGLELRNCDWLVERESSSFWLSIYDSRVEGVTPRAKPARGDLGPLADKIASEQ